MLFVSSTSASTASHPAFVTIAKRPSFEAGPARSITASTNSGSDLFSPEGVDTKKQREPVGQITCRSIGKFARLFEPQLLRNRLSIGTSHGPGICIGQSSAVPALDPRN